MHLLGTIFICRLNYVSYSNDYFVIFYFPAKEKEKLYVELKHILARQPGPEAAEQLQQCQWTIRERTKKLKVIPHILFLPVKAYTVSHVFVFLFSCVFLAVVHFFMFSRLTPLDSGFAKSTISFSVLHNPVSIIHLKHLSKLP